MRSNFIKVVFFVICLLFVFSFFAKAWVDPTATPPGANIFAPLNSSSFGQAKLGGLILNLGGAAHGLIVKKGRVGVKTANPQAELDVAGKIGGSELEIYSTTEGILIPRMATEERDRISNLAEGSLIYNTTQKVFNYFAGGRWNTVGESVTSSITNKITTEYLVGDGRPGDFYCKKKNITPENQQEDWININNGKACGQNKTCQNGECKQP